MSLILILLYSNSLLGLYKTIPYFYPVFTQ